VTNSWSGQFQAEVTVTNGNTPRTAWTVTWTFPNGAVITQAWGAVIPIPPPSPVVARNANYNGTLGAGASTTFGMIANGNGATSTPATITCS
jgi:cellulase/cellobiase CelA1